MTKLERYEEALDYIAKYILPVRPINNVKYVELSVAEVLRNKAKEALSANSSKTR